MAPEAEDEASDGRNARAARTHAALIDALFELLDEGDVQPTAERIAERAGVSPRSVYQHFSDRERLFEAAAERQLSRVGPLLTYLSDEGPLPERLDAFVGQRATLYEAVSSFRRAALLLEHAHEDVARRLGLVRQVKRDEALRVFAPELALLPSRERRVAGAALGAASSWSTWEALRRHQGLGVPAATAALRRLVEAALKG